jgi:hypothetical protein
MSHQHEEPQTSPPELTGDDDGDGIAAAAEDLARASASGDVAEADAGPVALSSDDSAELRPSEDPWASLAVTDEENDDEEDKSADDATATAAVTSVAAVAAVAAVAHIEREIRPPAVMVDNGAGDEAADEEFAATESVIVVEPRATAPESVIIAGAVAAAQAVATATLAPVEVDDLDEEGAEAAGEDASVAASLNESAVEAAVEEAVALRAEEIASTPSRGGMFTIPLMCAGIAIIAACLLIPQADANRRLAYERQKLQADLEATNHQVETNDEFLNKIAADPNLAERLAQRQMKIIRKGNEVLKLGKEPDGTEMSPFQLTAVAPPPELPPYQSRGGALARLCYDPKSRLYLIGAGLMAMAAGLVLGFAPKPE